MVMMMMRRIYCTTISEQSAYLQDEGEDLQLREERSIAFTAWGWGCSGAAAVLQHPCLLVTRLLVTHPFVTRLRKPDSRTTHRYNMHVTYRQIDRQVDRWMDRQIEVDRWIDRQIGRQMDRQVDRQMDGQIGRQIDGQRDVQIDRQIDRQIGRQIDRSGDRRYEPSSHRIGQRQQCFRPVRTLLDILILIQLML